MGFSLTSKSFSLESKACFNAASTRRPTSPVDDDVEEEEEEAVEDEAEKASLTRAGCCAFDGVAGADTAGAAGSLTGATAIPGGK